MHTTMLRIYCGPAVYPRTSQLLRFSFLMRRHLLDPRCCPVLGLCVPLLLVVRSACVASKSPANKESRNQYHRACSINTGLAEVLQISTEFLPWDAGRPRELPPTSGVSWASKSVDLSNSSTNSSSCSNGTCVMMRL